MEVATTGPSPISNDHGGETGSSSGQSPGVRTWRLSGLCGDSATKKPSFDAVGLMGLQLACHAEGATVGDRPAPDGRRRRVVIVTQRTGKITSLPVIRERRPAAGAVVVC